eukprot:403342108
MGIINKLDKDYHSNIVQSNYNQQIQPLLKLQQAVSQRHSTIYSQNGKLQMLMQKGPVYSQKICPTQYER